MGKTGIIGGSALYDIDVLEISGIEKVNTPFGAPSDEFVIGKLAGKEVVFLPRHGRGHKLLPTEINCRANIYAFKVLGVDRIIAVSAVGSLREEIPPLDIVLVDQFIDRTNQGRPATFFGDGIVAHIPFAEPVCEELRQNIYKSNRNIGVKVHNGGTYINMEGPVFSTKAESRLFRSWGADVIGMTNMSEARLAREAGMCYSTIAMSTDYDCWHMDVSVESVTVEMIIGNLVKNIETAKTMLSNVLRSLPEECTCACGETLRDAIITKKEDVPVDVLENLEPIIGKFV